VSNSESIVYPTRIVSLQNNKEMPPLLSKEEEEMPHSGANIIPRSTLLRIYPIVVTDEQQRRSFRGLHVPRPEWLGSSDQSAP
jgi:hypothetical protein